MTVADLRAALKDARLLPRNAFAVLSSIARLLGRDPHEPAHQELVLRALEKRELFGQSAHVLDALVREVGLFPYIDPQTLSGPDLVAYEFHRPIGMEDEIVFHRPQAEVYRHLLNGENVVLSAPTSFGKSLVIDAVVAAGRFKNILIVVPTIALIDETRRRLTQRARDSYHVITHASQRRGDRNIFILTQERALDLKDIENIDFFVIDEFYKLAPGRDDDERCAALNHAFYRLAKTGAQFYMLGPGVRGLSGPVRQRVKYQYLAEPYHTVVSELHDVEPVGDEFERLTNLCRGLDGPTIIFCKSPKRAAEVAHALIGSGIEHSHRANHQAAQWIAHHYHPEWHVGLALKQGIGVHHGRVPRAIAQYIVRAFDDSELRYLICTSTLIEGVNTKAENIVIFDNVISGNEIDFFTFNNIRGRAGRMRRHFVGHVYLFHPVPQEELPFVDVPAFTQSDTAPESLLIQLENEDLTAQSRGRIDDILQQDVLSLTTLRANTGIDPRTQLAIAEEITASPPDYFPHLSWRRLPTARQVQFVCKLLWRHIEGIRLGAASVRSDRQLAFLVNALRRSPTVRTLVQRQLDFMQGDPDDAVQQVLDFQRLWAMYHFPRLLKALDRIQREVFSRIGLQPGDYDFFASRVESLFLDPAIVALDEYGIPVEIGRKLPALSSDGDLDDALSRLRDLDVDATGLSAFEKKVLRDAQDHA